jgi:hypothetical protein
MATALSTANAARTSPECAWTIVMGGQAQARRRGLQWDTEVRPGNFTLSGARPGLARSVGSQEPLRSGDWPFPAERRSSVARRRCSAAGHARIASPRRITTCESPSAHAP